MGLLRLLFGLALAFGMGQVMRKLRMPAILGWLIAGMAIGPYALSIINQPMMDSTWYQLLKNFFEIGIGCLLGTELRFEDLRKSGKQILVITLIQSLGTFVFVTLVFGVIFHFINVSFYVALLIGSIALATAPAPALSVVQEYDAKGPVTSTLIPITVLDDVVAIVVFFGVISFVTATNTGQSTSFLLTLVSMIALPLVIGSVIGYLATPLLKKYTSLNQTRLIVIIGALVNVAIGALINHFIFGFPMVNFTLIGLAFSAIFTNLVSQEHLTNIMEATGLFVRISLLNVITSLGAALDYHLIIGSGFFTFLYIAARTAGKYFNTRFGARLTGMPKTVQKYLGLTLLTHSGVSLVFTDAAASTLSMFDPKSALLIQGTIAAAAIINEIIAVLLSKKAFEWAGEIQTN